MDGEIEMRRDEISSWTPLTPAFISDAERQAALHLSALPVHKSLPLTSAA